MGPEGQACWAQLPPQPAAGAGAGVPLGTLLSLGPPSLGHKPTLCVSFRLHWSCPAVWPGSAVGDSGCQPLHRDGVPLPAEVSPGGQAVSEVLCPVEPSQVTLSFCFSPRSSQAGGGRRGVCVLGEARRLGPRPGGGKRGRGEFPCVGRRHRGLVAVVSGGTGAGHLQTQAIRGVQTPVPGLLPRSWILGSPGLWLWTGPKAVQK